MTYSVASSGKKGLEVIYFIPVGVGHYPGTTLHCYRFEIDSNNMVKNYKINSSAGDDRNQSCRKVLKNDWELPDLEIRAMQKLSAQSEFIEGDLISMTTDKEITIASTKVTSLKMVVVESDITKITGRLSGFLSYVDEAMENEIGSIVEIMRVDIEDIWFEYRP
jgi:hypothetical protein